MLKVMKNAFRILFRQKSVLAGIILIPTLLTLIFSFLMGSDVNIGVGVINNDNGIVSEEILSSLKNTKGITLIETNEDNVDSALVGKEIEVAIIFPE
ncbi:MAG: hypothetical protein ACRC2K_03360, partial [Clostridium sp.]